MRWTDPSDQLPGCGDKMRLTPQQWRSPHTGERSKDGKHTWWNMVHAGMAEYQMQNQDDSCDHIHHDYTKALLEYAP